jgi:hypothetical protein
VVATKIAGEAVGGVNIRMGKVIRMESYRKDKRSSQQSEQRRRMHSGFAFAETALMIMVDEARKRGHADLPAIWYATARASLQALRHTGWTTEDLIRLVKDKD